MSTGADLFTLMTAVAHQVRDLSPEELRRLLAGEAELRYVPNELAAAVERLRRLPAAEVESLLERMAKPKPEPAPAEPAPKATRAARPSAAAMSAAPISAAPISAAPTSSATGPAVDPGAVRAELASFGSEAEATAYLNGLGLKATGLRELATGLGLRLPSKAGAGAIIAEIVRVFVRGRLNTATIQRL